MTARARTCAGAFTDEEIAAGAELLAHFLRQVASIAPASCEAFVLAHGVAMPNVTRARQPGPVGWCYENATRYLARHPDASYVEGFAVDLRYGVPMQHAWCATPDGAAIEVTRGWSAFTVYYGVLFPAQLAIERALAGYQLSLLYAPDVDHAIVRAEPYSHELALANVRAAVAKTDPKQRKRWSTLPAIAPELARSLRRALERMADTDIHAVYSQHDHQGEPTNANHHSRARDRSAGDAARSNAARRPD